MCVIMAHYFWYKDVHCLPKIGERLKFSHECTTGKENSEEQHKTAHQCYVLFLNRGKTSMLFPR